MLGSVSISAYLERDQSRVANSTIPSKSWHTAQGRQGEYVRFLLCSFRLLELVQELERWLEERYSGRSNMDRTRDLGRNVKPRYGVQQYMY